ncbi:hypothetical protein AB0F88_31560 [Streptosporangium sp. NPDC023963]|uniref:hypothetical protein n=1 Tax=Streptosporangium sp. NPDC023963 TaxID=3155608 RepID=UPI00342CECE4
MAISRSAGASVTSRSTNSAASNVTADACELRARRRRCDGDSTAARARQDTSTFGATSANRFPGSPDRADRGQLVDLTQHRLQTDVARHRLDQRQHRIARPQ